MPVTGGGWTKILEHSAAGREGAPDSFVFDPGPGGHAYVTTTSPAGESCASDPVYVQGSQITGVEVHGADEVLSVSVYDVRGRKIKAAKKSGIYWRVTRYSSGRIDRRRFVVVR